MFIKMKFSLKALLLTMIFLVSSVCFVSAETTADKSTDVEIVIDLNVPSTTLSILNSTDFDFDNFSISEDLELGTSLKTEVKDFSNCKYIMVCGASQSYKQIVNPNYKPCKLSDNKTVEITHRTGIGLSK